jgi:hypothetical protein
MPNVAILCVSVVCLIAGVSVVLFPRQLLGVSRALSRPLVTLDESLIRHRYAFGALLFVASYLCFSLAMMSAAF